MDVSIKIDFLFSKKIDWIKKSRLFNTSPELMLVLYKELSELPFVDNLAIVVRDARKGRPTFSLIYFWNTEWLGNGYITLASNRKMSDIKSQLQVIKKHGDLSGYFDTLVTQIMMVAPEHCD